MFGQQQTQLVAQNPATQANAAVDVPKRNQDVSYLNISDSPSSNYTERASLRRFSSMSAAKPTTKSTKSNKSSISNSSKKVTDWTSESSSHNDKYITNSSNSSSLTSASVARTSSIDDVPLEKSYSNNFTESRRTTASAMLMSFGSASNSFNMTSPPTPYSTVDTEKKTGLTPSNSDTPSDDRFMSPHNISEPIQCCSLTNPEYQIFPSREELKKQEQDRDFRYLKNVPDFTIKNAFGSIQWNGKVDVSGVDLDKAISIEYGKVTVYGDNYPEKPPVGMKLNRAALITINLNSDEPVTREDLIESNEESGARFISYVYDESINKFRWIFSVEHFSSHGLSGKLSSKKAASENNSAGFFISGGSSVSANLSAIFGTPSAPISGGSIAPTPSVPANTVPSSSSPRNTPIRANAPVISHVIDTSARTAPVISLDSSKSSSMKILKETIKSKPHQADRSFFLRGSFRVGWGVNGVLAHVGRNRLFNEADKDVPAANSVRLEHVDTLRWSKKQSPAATVQFDKVLDKVRTFSKIKGDLSGAKYFSVPDGTSNDSTEYKLYLDMLLSIMKEYRQQKDQSRVDLMALQVTELVNAVLGQEEPNRPSADSVAPPVEGNSCAKYYINWNLQDERRSELISRWLSAVCQNEVDAKMPAELQPYRRIFDELSCRRIPKAIDLAMEAGLYRLATIIAQVDGTSCDTILINQIYEWSDMDVLKEDNKLFHSELRNIYLLLSGSEAVEVTNIGWRRALGVLYWYTSPFEWSQMDHNSQLRSNRFMLALQKYDEILSDNQVDRPEPKWKNDADRLGSRVREDGLFHLLKLLICSPNGGITNATSVLRNEGYTRDPLDYRISYLVLTFLSAARVGNISDASAAIVTQHLMHQLLSMNLVKEAIFIGMQIPEGSKRKLVVKEIINRAISFDGAAATDSSPTSLFASIDGWLASSSVWKYVTIDLQVPKEWVYEGLAYYFRNSFNESKRGMPQPLISAREKCVAREVYCLQKAGMHAEAVGVLNKQLCMWYLHPVDQKEGVGEQHVLMSHLLSEYPAVTRGKLGIKGPVDWLFIDYFYIAKRKYNGEILSNDDEVIKLYEKIYTANAADELAIPSLTSAVRCTIGETLLKLNRAPTTDSYRRIMSNYSLQNNSCKVDFNIKQLLDVELAASLRRACERA